MQTFFEIGSNQAVTVADYLESIESPMKRLMAENLFSEAKALVESIRSDYYPKPDRPIIKVKPTAAFHAAGMEGMIEISSGVVEHCLAMPPVPYERIVQIPLHEPSFPSNFPNALFAWMVAHEYWHGVRRHNTALTSREDSAAHAKAVEIDADLCATSSFYRWVQQAMAPHYSDSTIRQMVFASLFWALRHLPPYTESKSHPRLMERLFHIEFKVIQLNSVRGLQVDPSVISKESESHIDAIVKVAMCAERIFKEQNPTDEHDFLAFTRAYSANRGWQAFTEPWDELRSRVSVSSGTLT